MGVEGRGAKGLGGTEKSKRREIDAREKGKIEQQPLKRRKKRSPIQLKKTNS